MVALGGNALLKRGEPLEAANQARAARTAARVLARVYSTHQLVITHGNGPQVGLLALMSDAYTETKLYPLDVLGSETEGQIGYVLELRWPTPCGTSRRSRSSRASSSMRTTRRSRRRRSSSARSTRRARHARSQSGTAGRSSATASDWRRVVASPAAPANRPAPTRSSGSSTPAFSSSAPAAEASPSSRIPPADQRGVEAVIDKDLASALLAERPGRGDAGAGHRRGRSLRRVRHARAAADRARHAGGAAGARVRRQGRWVRRSRRCAASSSAPAPAPRSGASMKSMICSRAAAARRCCRMAPSWNTEKGRIEMTEQLERAVSFSVESEVGTLRKVIVHRPGLEHTRLTPSQRRGAAVRRCDLGQAGQGGTRRVLSR